MEQPESSLPYSQAPANCPYPEPTSSSPHIVFMFVISVLHFGMFCVDSFQQDRPSKYKVTMRLVRAIIVVVEKLYVLHILSVFAALGMQYAMCMRDIVICGVSVSTVYFHVISWTARYSKKEIIEHKHVFWFSLQPGSQTFFIARRTERDVIVNVRILIFICSSLPIILVRF